jgi:hypothetical protein
MSQEMPLVVTTNERRVEPLPVEVTASHVELAMPTREQIEAANGLFAQHREADLMAGLAGMWAGTLLLHGLAVDTFAVEEEEPKNKPRPQRP